MTIFFYKELTKNPEIGNTLVWVLPNIWRLGQVRDTKFATNVSSEKLLNAAKCQYYSFYRFWDFKSYRLGLKRLMLSIYKDASSTIFTAQKMKFSIKDFFSKCDEIRKAVIGEKEWFWCLWTSYLAWMPRQVFSTWQTMKRILLVFNGFYRTIIFPFTYHSLPISLRSHNNDMPKVSHYNSVFCLKYTHPKCMKSLFTNIQKNSSLKVTLPLKSINQYVAYLLQKKKNNNTNFTRK